jgi:hypothetical protein
MVHKLVIEHLKGDWTAKGIIVRKACLQPQLVDVRPAWNANDSLPCIDIRRFHNEASFDDPLEFQGHATFRSLFSAEATIDFPFCCGHIRRPPHAVFVH